MHALGRQELDGETQPVGIRLAVLMAQLDIAIVGLGGGADREVEPWTDRQTDTGRRGGWWSGTDTLSGASSLAYGVR